ncbi:MAG: HRDC domain-containing protein [Actinobacteria bacterium]|nr:HRDC domain-containing protein [Actinomycetota bacterium]
MSDEQAADEQPTGIAIDQPREGLPELITTEKQLALAANLLKAGTGPVALDAERASGFKYSGRAYLVQLRRIGSGTFLIDPNYFANLSLIQEALTDVDWILHAASQDLVCLREAGLYPTAQLFDTELAGRILGCDRVGLGPLLLAELGFSLAKEHSAADWSTRPLPTQWLNYAALDVEFLIELWAILSEQLIAAEKYDWAIQEFNHVKDNTVPIVREDPWRRTSGLHGARKPRQLAIVRALWNARDQIARDQDIAPGRVLPDSIFVQIANEAVESDIRIEELPALNGRLTRRNKKLWVGAVYDALALSEDELPATRVRSTTPPPPRTWQEKNPTAFAQLEQVRSGIAALGESLQMPVENLITPETVRRILWTPPKDEAELQQMLDSYNARIWQQELIMPLLRKALFDAPISTELESATD